MTTRDRAIGEDQLQAFVDGQLPPEGRRAVMAYLAGDGEEAQRLNDYRSLNEAMHLVYDEVLHEPLPERLKVERYQGRRLWLDGCRRWLEAGTRGLAPRLAAAMLVVLLSGSGGWWLHGVYRTPVYETPAASFARQAASAHLLYAPDLRHPVEFGADQQDSLLIWLSERLGHAVHAPNLQRLGFALVGGRLLPASGQPAAQLMYENPEAKRITLFIRARWTAPPAMTTAQEGTVNYATEGGVSMVWWTEGPFAYALTGQMDREAFFAAAKMIQDELHTPPALPGSTAEQVPAKDST
jgi:anti-sigma factor RsiW